MYIFFSFFMSFFEVLKNLKISLNIIGELIFMRSVLPHCSVECLTISNHLCFSSLVLFIVLSDMIGVNSVTPSSTFLSIISFNIFPLGIH